MESNLRINLDDYPIKLIVAGGRDFTNYGFMGQTLRREFLRAIENNKVVLVHGAARGADSMAEKWWLKNKFSEDLIVRFPAEWDSFGPAAGPIRNKSMAEIGTHLMAYPTGGPGTKNMIDLALKYGLWVKVNTPEQQEGTK